MVDETHERLKLALQMLATNGPTTNEKINYHTTISHQHLDNERDATTSQNAINAKFVAKHDLLIALDPYV